MTGERTGSTIDLAAVRAQAGPAYDRFPLAEQRRHVALLQAVHSARDVVFDVRARRGGRWSVTVCTADVPGALSFIAGLFTVYRIDIVQADIFTLDLPEPLVSQPAVARSVYGRRPVAPQPTRPSHYILDVFDVRAMEGLDETAWERLRTDLADLIKISHQGEPQDAQERVIERVSATAKEMLTPPSQLWPASIEVRNEPDEPFTRLSIHSEDTPGFLFAFTNALATNHVNIARAEIRTVRSEARDTFGLTDTLTRGPLPESRFDDLRIVAALVKHFTYLLPRSANPAQALRQFNALTEQLVAQPQWMQHLSNLESSSVLETLAELMGVSRFLWEDFLRMQHENLFPVLMDAPGIERRKSKQQMSRDLQAALKHAEDHETRVTELNSFKDREMFRIDLRHITRRVDFRDFSEELSDLAEIVVGEAAALAHEALRPSLGVPRLQDDQPCGWVIGGLGKFGGRELGFGSDIELLFIYEADGETDGVERVDNASYFIQFAQIFQETLRGHREGIFEIDLRLRPHGRAGPVASSLDAFTHYYRDGGEAAHYERMALVKLRPVAGDAALGEHLLQARDAYVYSGAEVDAANIAHLRHRQATELVPHGMTNAKYSSGGLVDVEYYVQACQMAVGHVLPAVRLPNTLDALNRLKEAGLVEVPFAASTRQTYIFLRRLIDALRIVRGNAKDLTIPPVGSPEFTYLSRRLFFESPEQLEAIVQDRMAFARQLWEYPLPKADNAVGHGATKATTSSRKRRSS